MKEKLRFLGNIELINVANASKFLREFDLGLYTDVHSEAIKRITKLSTEERQSLNSIYSSHEIMTDTPFRI